MSRSTYPTDEECLAILRAEQCLPNILDHCLVVQRVALALYDALAQPAPV